MGKSVIKSGERKPLAKGLYRLDLRDISARAATSLAQARAESEQIVARAREDAETQLAAAQQDGYREGFERGLAEGREAGRREALEASSQQLASDQASLVQALTTLVEDFGARREEFFLSARRDVVVLAVTIARRLARRMPRIEGEASKASIDACEDALALLSKPTDVLIRVHPDDLDAMELHFQGTATDGGRPEALAAAGRAIASTGCLRFHADASVERGGVVIGTADCEVDATLDGRVERIADELEAAWRERADDLGIGPRSVGDSPGDERGNAPDSD